MLLYSFLAFSRTCLQVPTGVGLPSVWATYHRSVLQTFWIKKKKGVFALFVHAVLLLVSLLPERSSPPPSTCVFVCGLPASAGLFLELRVNLFHVVPISRVREVG